MIAATIIGSQPHRYHYLAADDYAGMVSRAFSVAEAADRELTVLGPEPFTMREALEVYRAACFPELRISTMPIWLFRLIATVRGDQTMRFVAMLFGAFAQLGESGDPKEANELLGAPQTTLAQWCARQARAGAAVT